MVALAVSLCGNAASILSVRGAEQGNRAVLTQANAALVIAQAEQTSAEMAKRLELICFRNDVAVFLSGAKADTRCNPNG
jgi:hypothetical protein